MNMDDLIFEMGQPNEILSCPEWTEWWAVDETGLHLEYAPGYEPENFETETTTDNETNIVIDVNLEYDNKMNYLQERYEDAFGDLDENYANNLYTESDIDLFSEKPMKPFPITQTSVDYDSWPIDYLEHIRDIIDQYNRDELKSYGESDNDTVENEDLEERVVDVPSTDGLILPS